MAAPNKAAKGRKIFLVDDHPVVRRGLAELINGESDLFVCGEAESSEAALPVIIRTQPDLVIADISLPGADGIELIRFMRKAHSNCPVLVLTMHEATDHAERAMRAGARGFIMKYRAMSDLLDAIRCVLDGRLFLSPDVAEQLLNRSLDPAGNGGMEGLSDRERQVMELLGQGHGTRTVAERLRLSIKTIETYRAKIKEKLNLSGASQLVQRAVQWVERKTQPAPKSRRSRRAAAAK